MQEQAVCLGLIFLLIKFTGTVQVRGPPPRPPPPQKKEKPLCVSGVIRLENKLKQNVMEYFVSDGCTTLRTTQHT